MKNYNNYSDEISVCDTHDINYINKLWFERQAQEDKLAMLALDEAAYEEIINISAIQKALGAN